MYKGQRTNTYEPETGQIIQILCINTGDNSYFAGRQEFTWEYPLQIVNDDKMYSINPTNFS